MCTKNKLEVKRKRKFVVKIYPSTDTYGFL